MRPDALERDTHLRVRRENDALLTEVAETGLTPIEVGYALFAYDDEVREETFH